MGVPIIRIKVFCGSILGFPYFGKLPYKVEGLRAKEPGGPLGRLTGASGEWGSEYKTPGLGWGNGYRDESGRLQGYLRDSTATMI